LNEINKKYNYKNYADIILQELGKRWSYDY
jgi:hypothetical protein